MIVKHVTEVLATKMAGQVHPVQVLSKYVIVEEILLAEVAPWVWQDFGASFVCRVAMFNMHSQFLGVVNALFANEDSAPF